MNASSSNKRGQRRERLIEVKSEIDQLKKSIESLLSEPPPSGADLETQYKIIRAKIAAIEEVEKDKPTLENLLTSLDADFQPVRRLYPYHSPGFLREAGTSVLADEYRFFVGALRGYILHAQQKYA